jgi:hypothetical protein
MRADCLPSTTPAVGENMPVRWEYATLAILDARASNGSDPTWRILVRFGGSPAAVNEVRPRVDINEWINWIGSQGWEMVGFETEYNYYQDQLIYGSSYRSQVFYFKRPVPGD